MNHLKTRIMKTISKKILEARKSKGLSQEELADIANISLRTVQRIENEENEPRGHTLSSICEALNLNIEELVNYGKIDNKEFFIYLHLSVLVGFLIPMGDIIAPLILWIVNKDKIIDLNIHGKNLLISRLLIHVSLFIFSISYLLSSFGTVDMISNTISKVLIVSLSIHILFTLIYPIYIAFNIYHSKNLKQYYPRFFK